MEQRYYVEFVGFTPGKGSYRVWDDLEQEFVGDVMTNSEAYNQARSLDADWRRSNGVLI